MEFQDKKLRCVDCGTEFVWTAGEQLFFADKNFKNEPKRCKGCKAKRASRPSAGAVMARERVETTTNCRRAGKKRRCRSGPRKDVLSSAGNASSRGSSREQASSHPGPSVDSYEATPTAWPFSFSGLPEIRRPAKGSPIAPLSIMPMSSPFDSSIS